MSSNTLSRLPEKSDHHLGPLNASVVIVEYADFECPYCADAMYLVDEIMKTQDDICFIFRHFPLSEIHHQAGYAAVAAEVAGQQNKFWEMHHALFENQSDLSAETIFEIARNLSLDLREFTINLEDKKFLEKVQKDYESGLRSCVEGTPTFYLNGVKYQGELTFEGLKKEIQEIKENDQIHIL